MDKEAIEYSKNGEVREGRPRIFHYLEQTIEYDKNLGELDRLRLLSNPALLRSHWEIKPDEMFKSAGLLGLELFEVMFPDVDELKPKPYEEHSIKKLELTDSLKTVRNILLEKFGFIRPSQKLARQIDRSPEDVEVLDLAYTPDTTTITYSLNMAPFTDRLHNIGQLQATLRTEKERNAIEDKRFNVSREDHTKHYAQMVAMTNLTLALQDPNLYIQRVHRDMKNYSFIKTLKSGKGPDTPYELTPSVHAYQYAKEAIKLGLNGLKKGPEKQLLQDPELIDALAIAYEYTQYQIIYAYLHDCYTTALGDTVMKGRRKTEEGFKEVSFSEDETLRNKIDYIVSDLSVFGLNQILIDFKLNKDLLATMVWSLAGEGDPCLPGELMKAKRKYPDEIIEHFPHLKELRYQASFDHDQRSGTITNAQALLNAVFPGGLKRKQDMEDSITPIGSIEDRLRLFMFALVAGLTKDDLEEALNQIDIDPKRLFIYIEEIDIGPRLQLKEVLLPTEEDDFKEILPVATRPGDVKEAITLFNILTMLDYQSPVRSTTEAFIRDLLAAGIFGESTMGTEELSFEQFRASEDFMIMDYLYDASPLMHWMINYGIDCSIVLSEDQIKALSTDGKTSNLLIQQWENPKVIDNKEGTLVLTEKNTAESWKTVADRKKDDPTDPHNYSIPKRLARAEDIYAKTKWFRTIDLTDVNWRQDFLKELNRGAITYSSATRALNEWMKLLSLSDSTTIQPNIYSVDGTVALTPIKVTEEGNYSYYLHEIPTVS